MRGVGAALRRVVGRLVRVVHKKDLNIIQKDMQSY
jgi:hypothetical protein